MFDFLDVEFDFGGEDGQGTLLGGADLNGDGIADQLYVDYDGDGIADAVLADLDGNGIPDQIGLDFSGDGIADAVLMDTSGNGAFDTFMMDADLDGSMDLCGTDTNNDGIIDTYNVGLDTDHDGAIDTFIRADDYNQDGTMDSEVIYRDTDQDGRFDEVSKIFDSDGDGIMDSTATYHDYNGDGKEDEIIRGQFLDTNGDGVFDTYLHSYDGNADKTYDTVSVYSVDAETGSIELETVHQNPACVAGAYLDELGHFNPQNANFEAISGDPAESMKNWEFQGDTGRCALYSQKFVIEELTHQQVDIDELVSLAEENGWFNESEGTPVLNMDKILEHYGIENEMSFHNSVSDIEECLQSGGKVIVSIDADEIWYGQNDSLFSPNNAPNHAVEVIGIDRSDPDAPMVILNDSGNPEGCGEMVPLDVFEDAWEDGNCQMIACMQGGGMFA